MMISSLLEVSVSRSVWWEMTWSTCLLTQNDHWVEESIRQRTSCCLYFSWDPFRLICREVPTVHQVSRLEGWNLTVLTLSNHWSLTFSNLVSCSVREQEIQSRTKSSTKHKECGWHTGWCLWGSVVYKKETRQRCFVSRGPVSFFIPSSKGLYRPFCKAVRGRMIWGYFMMSNSIFPNKLL